MGESIKLIHTDGHVDQGKAGKVYDRNPQKEEKGIFRFKEKGISKIQVKMKRIHIFYDFRPGRIIGCSRYKKSRFSALDNLV